MTVKEHKTIEMLDKISEFVNDEKLTQTEKLSHILALSFKIKNYIDLENDDANIAYPNLSY